jgi:hypothetical protein
MNLCIAEGSWDTQRKVFRERVTGCWLLAWRATAIAAARYCSLLLLMHTVKVSVASLQFQIVAD